MIPLRFPPPDLLPPEPRLAGLGKRVFDRQDGDEPRSGFGRKSHFSAKTLRSARTADLRGCDKRRSLLQTSSLLNPDWRVWGSLGKGYIIARTFPFNLSEVKRSEEIADHIPPSPQSSFPVETVESRIKPENSGKTGALLFYKKVSVETCCCPKMPDWPGLGRNIK